MSIFRNLYIHIPFCRAKCDYCAFYSEPGREEMIAAYINRLREDIIKAELPEKIDSVYIGGGTPTLLPSAMLQRIIEILPEAEERSIEANPETINESNIELLAENFSRISLGIQSFDPDLRNILGRKCSQNSIERALGMIAQAGFKHWNIDLIYGIGRQSLKAWQWELEQALSVPVDHLSCYALTREENSILAENAQCPDHEEREADMAELTRDILKGRMRQYEISNYSTDNGRCLHNLNVWRGRRYLGIGAAAASFDGNIRWTQVADIDGYIRRQAPEKDILPPFQRAKEVFAVNLRTVDGWTEQSWNEAELTEHFPWEDMVKLSAEVAELYPGLIEYDRHYVKLNQRGRDFWDAIAAEFM